MEKSKALHYFSLGILPMKGESEKNFLKRGGKLTARETALPQKVFNTTPTWVEIKYDSAPLSFWEGGCTLIDEETFESEIFIHPKTKNKKEVVTHELVHAVRAPLKSHFFEELIAYQTSRQTWRAVFSPLFLTPKEATLFLVLSFLPPLSLIIPGALFLNIFFFSFLAFTGTRLVLIHLLFNRAKRSLHSLKGSKKKQLDFLMRLSDGEIFFLARNGERKLREKMQFSPSLRLHLLNELYP